MTDKPLHRQLLDVNYDHLASLNEDNIAEWVSEQLDIRLTINHSTRRLQTATILLAASPNVTLTTHDCKLSIIAHDGKTYTEHAPCGVCELIENYLADFWAID